MVEHKDFKLNWQRIMCIAIRDVSFLTACVFAARIIVFWAQHPELTQMQMLLGHPIWYVLVFSGSMVLALAQDELRNK
jgi:hypothetical protein